MLAVTMVAAFIVPVVVRILDPMFARPRGVLGKLGGRVMARTNSDVERRAVELAELAPGQTVLVVGPGPGVGLKLAAARLDGVGVVIGVEPSAAMRAQALRRCAALIHDGRIEVRDGHAAHTGAADASADVVISVNNVMFWPDRDAALVELHRALRPGGRLLIATHEVGLRVAGIGLDQLRGEVERAGFTGVTLHRREHASLMGSGVELVASRPNGTV